MTPARRPGANPAASSVHRLMIAATNLATGRTPDRTELMLQKHDGEYYLGLGGIPPMSTRAAASEQQMAESVCGKLRAGSRLPIGALGFGFSLRRVLKLVSPEATVQVAEQLPEIIDWNREFLAEVNCRLLDDPRVSIHQEDVFELISRCGNDRYDAILLDVDNRPPLTRTCRPVPAP